jgi:hypothetical protein
MTSESPAYEEQEWKVGRRGQTPFTADRMNHLERGVGNAHGRLDRVQLVAGPPGPKGVDGRSVRRFSGSGPPPDAIIGASPGDEYLDVLTGDLYVLT